MRRGVSLPVMAKTELCRLIPHQGSMCLLHTVEMWTDTSIDCSAQSHRETSNPLRLNDKLDAICGLEYAAQAMAVHIGLVNGSIPPRKHIGYLGGIRDVLLLTDRLDTWGDDLLINSTRLFAEHDSFLYQFRIHVSGRDLVSGRVSVFLKFIDE